MTHHTLDYANRIRQQGYRLTPQRELVLDAVCEGGGHTSFDEIQRRVQARAPAVNRSTIYRTLEFLEKLNLVVVAHIEGRTLYEIAHARPHHHLICSRCGAEIEIDETMLTPAYDRIAERTGFVVHADHLVLSGLCGECNAK
ncbi:MAG TPA: transcriptional repressor [Caldilineae bacterium]|nr:transcriptional repressor [Caldilineae bacterium]